MKYYNAKFIKDFIEKRKDDIKVVEVGMSEDWSWTAKTIFNEKEGFSYPLDLRKDNKIEIAGINGSTWATPVMRVIYKDEHIEIVECWEDDGNITSEIEINKQKAFAALTGGMDSVV